MQTPLPDRSPRRRAILDAALECFTDHGYAATSISDVLASAGASTGSLYHFFRGKRDLAAALYLESVDDYQTGFLNVLSAEPTAEGGIKQVVLHHVRWAVENRRRARFLLISRPSEVVASEREQLDRRNTHFFETCLAWLGPHVTARQIRDVPLDLYYPLWLGPAQEYVKAWMRGAETRPSKAAPLLAAAAWHALRDG